MECDVPHSIFTDPSIRLEVKKWTLGGLVPTSQDRLASGLNPGWAALKQLPFAQCHQVLVWLQSQGSLTGTAD